MMSVRPTDNAMAVTPAHSTPVRERPVKRAYTIPTIRKKTVRISKIFASIFISAFFLGQLPSATDSDRCRRSVVNGVVLVAIGD